MRAGILSRYNSQVHMAHMCAIRVRGPSRPVACEAKKGKKGGKKGNKKGGSLLGDLANAPKIQPWQTTEVIMQHLLMIECYRRAAGKPLVENAEIDKIADVLYEAPFAILAHNRFAPNVPDEEAVFTYGNKAGMEAFQADRFEDLVGMLSSKCIEGLEDTELASREKYLTAILPSQNETSVQQGEAAEQDDDDEVEGDRRSVAGSDAELKIAPAGGRRVGLKGRIFTIDATVWNIVSPTGTVLGQAACFDSYSLEDGTVVRFDADPDSPTEASPEAIAAAEAAVEEQAAAVRELKEQEGMTNKSLEVQGAVDELLARKQRLQALQDVTAAAEATA